MNVNKTVILSEEELRQVMRDEMSSFSEELRELKKLINPINRDRALTARQAAELLGVSLSTLYKKVNLIPHKKFGKKLIFSSKQLESLDYSLLGR